MSTPPEEIRIGALAIRFLIDGTASPAPLTMFEFSVPPGAKLPISHSHDAYEETAYQLEGVLTLTLFDSDGTPRRHQCHPGDHLLIPRGVVHRFDNFHPAPSRTLAVVTPGILGAAYFREMAAAVAAATAAKSPPDPKAMAAIMLRHGLTPHPEMG